MKALRACYDAQQMANQYTEETGKKECAMEIYNMFKILLIPTESLKESLAIQGLDAMSSSFRKFAVMVHPDKNPHPRAAEAFNKLYTAFNEAKAQMKI